MGLAVEVADDDLRAALGAAPPAPVAPDPDLGLSAARLALLLLGHGRAARIPA